MTKLDGREFFGAATVGERGQIVIPVEARKRFDIETGDKLLVFGRTHRRSLVIVKAEVFEEFLDRQFNDLQELEKLARSQRDPEKNEEGEST